MNENEIQFQTSSKFNKRTERTFKEESEVLLYDFE